jgi:hypothetical protein
LRRLWRAVEVSVVALEQSGIVPAGGNGEGGNVFFRRCGQRFVPRNLANCKVFVICTNDPT